MGINRREFVAGAAWLGVAMRAQGYGGDGSEGMGDGKAAWDGRPSPLLNYNYSTAIGLGDQPAGIVDQFGHLRGRNVQVLLDS
jgi:hypothetical protein